MWHVMLKYLFVQDVVEKKLTSLAYINTKLNKADLMTISHTFEAHMRGCAMLGVRLSGDEEKTHLKTELRRRSVTDVKE